MARPHTLTTVTGSKGMVTAPHWLAAEAGLSVLQDGGNAVEATVAVAACLAVVYPHMTGIGGDGFWVIHEPDGAVNGIHGCGGAAGAASLELYAGLEAVPFRGPLAANTVAGTISGWAAALESAGGSLPLSRLLRDAIAHGEAGGAVTAGHAAIAAAKGPELRVQPGAYATTFEPEGRPLHEGDVLRQPVLAQTLRRLCEEGLESFYTGPLSADIAADLAALGSPVSGADLAAHVATRPEPLTTQLRDCRLWNSAPPTQGFASLVILALFDRLAADAADGFDHVHGLVEATKQAFLLRDVHVGDPAYHDFDWQGLLSDPAALDELAARIDPAKALGWPQPPQWGDTCWFGAADGEGRVVSAIQSTYFEFGSGLVLPRTGITWQNRGSSFRLAADGWNALRPGRKPFHTLNPALARFDDGRVMAYGTMGGEGQPQTQAALFSRYARFGMDLQAAISAPRWLLGRTWGEQSTTLKLEDGFDPALYAALAEAGHDVERVGPLTATMGHAGAIVRHADGRLEGATDPRSDGGGGGVVGGARAVSRCDELTLPPFSDSASGLTRTYLSPAYFAAQDRLAAWMAEAGMAVRRDAAMNLVGRYEGAVAGAPALVIGSHLDSVRNAGAYDGPLGIMLGVEAVAALHGRGVRLPFAVEVYAFGDEEGSRFPAAMLTSRAVAGTLDPAALEVADRDGVALAELVDVAAYPGAARGKGEVIAYLEAHIEQGPVLEAQGLAVGTVTGIAAQLRYEVELGGTAGHAGTTAMDLRRDAVAGMAEMVLAAESVAKAGPADLVATVGVVQVPSGAANVIAGKCSFTLDVRAASASTRDAAADEILRRFRAIANARDLGLAVRKGHDLPASPCDPVLMQLLDQATAAAGHAPFRLVSGAGHDAMIMAALCPTAMLFVRCRGGVSHNPAEHVDPSDAQVALQVMLGFIEQLGASLEPA